MRRLRVIVGLAAAVLGSRLAAWGLDVWLRAGGVSATPPRFHEWARGHARAVRRSVEAEALIEASR